MKTILLLLSVFVSVSLFSQSPYFFSGNKHLEKGENKEAIDDFTREIKINPDYADAYYNRGIAYFKLGKTQEAISDFTSAIRINPNLWAALYNRGVAYRTLGKYQEAIDDYDTAIQINPNQADAYNNRGVVKYMLGIDGCSDLRRAESLGLSVNPEAMKAICH